MTAPEPRPLDVVEQRVLEALSGAPYRHRSSINLGARVLNSSEALATLQGRGLARVVDLGNWAITERGRQYLATLHRDTGATP